MPLIHLISHEGVTEPLDAPEGNSLMQAALAAGVRGIVGECGGAAICATCHVYIDPAWLDRLTPALPNELEMLEFTASKRLPESRLACQVKAKADLDGMVIRLPATQQ